MNGNALKIFYADSTASTSAMIKKIIGRVFNENYLLEYFDNDEFLSDVINKKQHDVYLIGRDIGRKTGLEIIDKFAKQIFEKPFIYITDLADCEEDIIAMKSGSKDYLVLEDTSDVLFERTIRYSIMSKRLESDLRKHRDDLVENQKKLISQEKKLSMLNLSKDRLLSIIGHDIRGPIGVISQITNILLNEDLDESDKVTFLHDINDQAIQTIDLLDNVLYWAKSQQNKLRVDLQIVKLNELIENNIKLFSNNAKLKNIKIIDRFNTTCFIKADREMVNLILRNLISNALKFTDIGGVIELDGIKNKHSVKISVTDNGKGIEQDLIDQILKGDVYKSRNGTNNEKGSGLGLGLCKDFVELHGGKFNITGSPGKGTSVSFTMDLAY